jgi:hypothetical protein
MSRRTGTWTLAAAVLLAFAGLVVLASLPTGADDPDGVVPAGARLAARAELDDAWVHVLSEGGRLRLQIAYEGPKGWLDVLLDAAPTDVVAAFSSSPGGGSVPALTAVYGRVNGDEVIVHWDSGDETVVPEGDGTYVAARAGTVGVSGVEVRADGATVTEVARG